MKKLFAIYVAFLAIAACFPSLDHLQGGEPEAPDADTPDTFVPDTFVPDVTKPPIVPTRVTTPTELTAAMKYCNLDQMRIVDDASGGIYRDDASTVFDAGGHPVTSCAAFDFGDRVDPLKVEVHARASKDTCGHKCTQCDGGNFFWMFVGPTGQIADAKFVTEIPLKLEAAELETVSYEKAFPATDVRYVFVCRAIAGDTKDDIAIDGVLVYPR